MESGADNSADQDTSTVTKYSEEPTEKRKRTFWWKEENYPRTNKSLERLRKATVYGVCDEGDLDSGKDIVLRMKVVNFLKRIDSKPIAYENAFPLRKRVLLLQRQVNYVEDIIVTREMANIGMVGR